MGRDRPIPASKQTLELSADRSQLAASYRAIMWVPQPMGMDAPAEHFSEARALRTAAYLSEDIGFRLVRTF